MKRTVAIERISLFPRKKFKKMIFRVVRSMDVKKIDFSRPISGTARPIVDLGTSLDSGSIDETKLPTEIERISLLHGKKSEKVNFGPIESLDDQILIFRDLSRERLDRSVISIHILIQYR